MKTRLHYLALILASSLSLSSFAATEENPWSKIQLPLPGDPESIGSPSAGCLKGALPLLDGGPGYWLTRPSRKRNFGHPRLVSLIQNVSQKNKASGKAPLLIGDLGQPRGGPTMSAHSSHQNGLDVDIWYYQHRPWKDVKKVPAKSRENLSAPGMVDKKNLVVNRHFGKDQIRLLRRFAESPEVDRILVSFPIKRELCNQFPDEEWIRKIRPWFGHDRHFHMRLTCSSTDELCKNGEPIPEGNGCDTTLDWWWSEEARSEETKNLDRQKHPVMPILPAECAPLTVNQGVRTL